MTNAQIAGRVAGIAYVHTRRTVALIDWAEVAAIVLHGLQVLIALTVLAGQMTRRAWDALPALSEQLGQWYSTALTDGCAGLRMVYSSLTGAPVTPTHHQAMTTSPLLSIGTFGVHLVSGAGSWSFAGCVPSDIKRGGYTTESDGIAAFVDWFKSQDIEFQRAHAADLRTDVFCAVLAA